MIWVELAAGANAKGVRVQKCETPRTVPVFGAVAVFDSWAPFSSDMFYRGKSAHLLMAVRERVSKMPKLFFIAV